jgi:hypothetical protein
LLAEPPELRPALERAELPALPNECHWPSLIAARTFDDRSPEDRSPDEPGLRLDPNPLLW